MSDRETNNYIIGCSIIALLWAAWNFWIVTGTK